MFVVVAGVLLDDEPRVPLSGDQDPVGGLAAARADPALGDRVHPGRVRRPGGGRKRVADLDPGLRPALLALVEPDERGDPMSPLRWTVKSTRALARELTRAGHRVSADTIAGLLREEGFSLQANAKTLKEANTATGMPSSAISTSRPVTIGTPASR